MVLTDMSWTLEQLSKHPQRDALLGIVNRKKQEQSTENEELIVNPVEKSTEPVQAVDKPKSYSFVVPGAPMGKPRMTQRDKWQKRPAVLRYREYCDRIRAAAGSLPPGAYAIAVLAWMPMPESWSKKKKEALCGQMCRSKPDWDNIGKAVCDALLEDDSILGGGTCWKFWCWDGQEQTQITVLLSS